MSGPESHSRPASSYGAAPLWIGLRVAAGELPNGSERRQLLELSRQLKNGEVSFSADSKSFFSTPLASILFAAKESGRFALVLGEYLRSSREVRTVWRTFWVQMAYPIIFLTLSLAVAGLFLVIVFRQMGGIFLGFGVELPFLTKVMISAGTFLINYWPILLIAFGLVLISPLFIHLLISRTLAARMVRAIPLVGSAARNAAAAELCSRMAVLVDARLPFPRTFDILSKTLRDELLRQASQRMADRISAGMPVGEAAQQERELPAQVIGALHWADAPDVLASGLREQERLFAAQAQVRMSQVRFITDPLLFISCSFLLGLIVFALFYPLVTLLSALS